MQPRMGMSELFVGVVADGDDEVIVVKDVVEGLGAVAFDVDSVALGNRDGAYIGAAYWFTSSTSFANPAVTVGRIFSDTFAGIAPASALFFIAAQLVGGFVGLGLVRFFFPDAPLVVGRAVVPHPNHLFKES